MTLWLCGAVVGSRYIEDDFQFGCVNSLSKMSSGVQGQWVSPLPTLSYTLTTSVVIIITLSLQFC